jgi:hypothetical protein
MLEGEFTLGEQPRLVEELDGLQVVEAAVWRRRLSAGGSRSMRAASTAYTVAGI